MTGKATSVQTQKPAVAPAASVKPQRNCACGNHTTSGGECASCATKKLQKKLSIGATNDPLELEADRVADRVLAYQPAHSFSNISAPKIQQRAEQSSPQTEEVPASVERVLAGSGSPLPITVRRDMEQRFRQDFSQVRMHTGSAAEQSARDVNANAYTVGNNIVFNRGMFSPETQNGKHLLAHELTHVVQQDARPANTINSNLKSIQNKTTNNYSDTVLRRDGIVEKVRNAVDPETRQFLSDLKDSVKQSPEHFVEFFTGELLEAVKANWMKIAAVTLGLLGAQLIIGGLEAAPTGITQIIGAILEIAVLAVLGYFAAVEVAGATEEGMHWWNTTRKANGDQKKITEASKAFVKMVWHIFMAILAVAGIRARIKAGAIPRVTAPLRAPVVEAPPVAPPQLRSIQGGKPDSIKIEGGKVVSSGVKSLSSGARGPVASSGEATARAYQPEPIPEKIPSPVREVPPLPKEPGSPVFPSTKPEAFSPLKSAAISVAGGLSSANPTPKPDLDSNLDEPRKKRGCTYESIAQQFGRYPCHAAYATHLSGVRREIRVTSADGESVDFDAMDHAQNLYEVKTGYRGIVFTRNLAYQNERISDFWLQAIMQMHVADSCGHKLRWYFNDPYVASFFGAENSPHPEYFHAPMPVEVWYEPFPCNVDR